MKNKFLILSFSILLTACSTTPEEETFEWEITNQEVVVEGCEKLKNEKDKADC